MFTKTLAFCGEKYLKLNKYNNVNKLKRCFAYSAILKQKESSEDSIVVDKDENITLIGINRPKQRNSIDFETAEKLSMAISNFETDKTSPIAVLYGIGGSFCASYDVKELEAQCEKGSLDFLLRHEGSVGPTRRCSGKPIIAGISGFCVGSGLELALMCDLRVMEESAIMGFFNRQFGVPMSDGGTVRLASMVGYSRALDLIISGRRITGKEAHEMGLVNRLVATGTGLGQAVNLAFSIAKFPQASVTKDRNTLYTNAYTRQKFSAAMQTEIMSTSREVLAELKEGVKLFKNSDLKGAKTDSFLVKPKPIPDWEKSEVDIENNLKSKQ